MIAFTINPDRHYVIITIEGEPSLEEYVDAARSLGQHPAFDANMHRICDFCQIEDLSVSTKELLAFVQEARELPMAASTRTALVASNQRNAGLMNLFASHFKTGEFRIFQDTNEALNWILDASPVQDPQEEAHGIRWHRLIGNISPGEVFRLQDSWFSQEDFDPDMPIMWDLRKARFTTNLLELDAVADRIHVYAREVRPQGNSAVLVASSLHEVLLKGAFKSDIEIGITRIFRNEKDALNWLATSLPDTT